MPDSKATRTFSCSHCSTEIRVPADLPPTTAPCPKCGQEVTSPALERDKEPEKNAERSATRTPSSTPSEGSSEQPREAQKEAPAEKPAPATAKKSIFPIVAAAVAIVLVAAVAAKLLLFPDKETVSSDSEAAAPSTSDDRQDRLYRTQGWIADAEETLEKFFQAETLAERAALTIRGSQNEAEMAAIFEEFDDDGHRTPVSVFSPVKLGEEDAERGMFLLTYNRPEQFAISSFFRPIPPMRVKYGLEEPDQFLRLEAAVSNFVDEPLRVMAFFRKTPEGLKLDWQTYAQTRYRLLNHFVNNPEPGRKGIFRVFIQEDVDIEGRDGAGYSVFRFTDPANTKDFAKVLVRDQSELGSALAHLKWRNRLVPRAPVRNATLSLVWTDDPQPALQMGELICWEFLGLGGERGNWRQQASE